MAHPGKSEDGWFLRFSWEYPTWASLLLSVPLAAGAAARASNALGGLAVIVLVTPLFAGLMRRRNQRYSSLDEMARDLRARAATAASDPRATARRRLVGLAILGVALATAVVLVQPWR